MSGGAAWLPVVACIAMTLGQSTVYSCATPQPRSATEPEQLRQERLPQSTGRLRHSTGETSTRVARGPRCTLTSAASCCIEWAVPRSTHSRESRNVAKAGSWPDVTGAYSAPDTVSCACSAPTSTVTSRLRTRRGGHPENLLRSAAGRAVGAHEATRTSSLYTLRRAWRIRVSRHRVPGPNAPFTAASTPTHRLWPPAHR